MLPIRRKSVEPLAAHLEPEDVSARHQSLHHFVAKSEWSDTALLEQVRRWVLPHMDPAGGLYWIIDDTGFPKKVKHSVGVARQYCGQLGKQDNCQVAVSLSVATEGASLPVSYRLYLPREWSDDPVRRQKAGVPEEIEFATKPGIATGQLHEARQSGAPDGIVLADAGYGDDTSFREAVSELGLQYTVGIRSNTRVWAPGTAPLPPEPSTGKSGRPRSLLRRAPGHEPTGVKDLASTLDASCYRNVIWREGTCAALSSRFAAVRVRASHRDYWRSTLRDEEWLLIEWPEDDAEPLKYWLSTLPQTRRSNDWFMSPRCAGVSSGTIRISSGSLAWDTSKDVAGVASITMHRCVLLPMDFLLLNASFKATVKKTPRSATRLPYPRITCHAGPQRAQRHVADSITTLRWRIAAYIARRLERCPFCSASNADLLTQ
ncbi:transposase, degenerate [Burkholderia sola]|nr:transposase, degenerate [Burkholderia cenocepacia]CAG2324489.1 transposase, degenerate [Burkholderia cenocepacia]CAG2324527.1 transposase, degenerate [Burkholderia cenocepacia]CAG2324542.1 transposase, degenerate [Burkholderia cenocepacia]CAG2324589.1 transposase, degenerate [Burkholderia cenocepacia]